MGKTILFWIYAISTGFSALIVIKSAILVPEELWKHPELGLILIVGIHAMIERCSQLWQSRISPTLPDTTSLGDGITSEDVSPPSLEP